MSLRQRLRALKTLREDQGGIILVEVIVAGLLLVIVSLGAFTAFDAATRSTAEERHRARASALAEADISRMRSMRISALSNLNQTRNVVQDDQRYTVTSQAQYQTDSTGTASCEAGAASADYIKITSTVTWPSLGSRPPVTSASLVAPPNGSISANSGALAIAVQDAEGVGIPGVGITGSGAGSFTGSTGSTGCVIFGNLPAGNYTVSVSGVASGLVDVDGDPPGPVSTSVVGESTNTVVLQYDDPGTIPIRFKTRPYSDPLTLVPSQADSVVVYNTGLTEGARTFGTAGTPQTELIASPMFPFTSDYAVYAGTCEDNNPNPQELDPPPAPSAIGSALVPPGGAAPQVEIVLPALHLTAYQGTNTSSAKASGATVKVRDLECGNLLRTFTTNADGQLDNPGLPYSAYLVCVSRQISANNFRRVTQTWLLNEPNDVNQVTTAPYFLPTSGTTFTQGCT